ncbi:MAG: hypothetical protein NT165_00820 [Candidatus Falkowbacteria bacterium]|nr:hypothetical protein [Candidatus Falkowbacteria bacterium]
MPLWLHLLTHFLLAVLVAWIFYRASKLRWISFTAAIMGGFFIDVDHIIEYLIVFHRFTLQGFFYGWQFLWSGKSYLIFHAWEYLPILLLLAYFLRHYRKVAIFIAILAGAGAVHLVTDCFINQYPAEFYSINYRLAHNFSAEELVPPKNLILGREEYQKWYPEMKLESER